MDFEIGGLLLAGQGLHLMQNWLGNGLFWGLLGMQ